MQTTCADCGRPLSHHDRHVRYGLPDPVLASGVEPGASGFWMSHATPSDSVMMQVDGVGAFVRALLPTNLTGGYTVTFGVWVGISPDDLRRVFDSWWAPEYVDLRVEGVLANDVAPWAVFASPVQLGVRDPDSTPYCVSSSNPVLQDVLDRVWPHELVLAAIPQ